MDYAPNFRAICGEVQAVQEYGRFQQHLVLLQDHVRVGAFFRAIDLAAESASGLVVDVGAGTGVLSLYALRRGFARAILVEPSLKIANYARYLFDRNGFGDRVTIVESTLEKVPDSAIPNDIDLVVSETLSSLVVGFGSWPELAKLRQRLSTFGTIVPFHGTVRAAFCRVPYATKNQSNGGLKLLSDVGLDIDLFLRTFWSGGNVFEKAKLSENDLSGKLEWFDLLSFSEQGLDVGARLVSTSGDGSFAGLVCYWDVGLSAYDPSVRLNSADPNLSSWYPLYIPFKRRIDIETGIKMFIRLELSPLDSPYPFAFRVMLDEHPVTHYLYW